MPNISPNFTTKEFECRCGCGFGSQPEHVSDVLKRLLEKLRHEIGDQPVYIISGCRCENYNSNLKRSSETSLHLFGMAADIKVPGVSFQKLVHTCKNIFDGVGVDFVNNTIHVDNRGYKVEWRYD